MHFDIVETIRQKQREYVRSVSIDDGDEIDIAVTDGVVVVRREPR